ncbi:MAG: FlgD immunoglobulin-like domain containing protein, partial [Candidatus Marinimicrobia bacterium]|nr:FlgD immunoglobulin-like domain containing protein [Candidatus Neomarinimicrobiota bacterium]
PPQVMMNPGFEEIWCCMNGWQNVATGWSQWPIENGSHFVAPTGDPIYGSSETLVPYEGDYSLKMWGLYNGAANTNAYYQTFTGESWNHPIFPPGTAISVDAEIMSHADDWIGQGTNTVTLFISYWDINWGFISRHDSPVFDAADEATVWHHRHADGVVPEGAVYVNIGVELSQADGNQHGSAYIDNLTAHLVPPESTGGNNVVVNTIQTGKVSNQFDMVDLIPKTNGLDLPIMEQADRSMLLGYEVRDGSDSVAATGMTQTWTNLFDEGWGNHVYTVVAVYDDAISVPSNEADVNLVNNPPGDFLLLAPPQGALLAINLDNADDQAAFMWEPSSDLVDNDPISYTISLTETTSGATVSFDTTTNGVFIDYMVFVELLTMADTVENTTFEWTVYANDGWDSTAAGNGPRAFTVDISNYLSAIENAGIPDEFALYNNYPNPFNPITNIKYDIPEVADVHLEIYNVAGQRIRTLVQGQQEPGRYKVQWAAKNDYGRPVASGMYIYRIRAGDFVSVKKLVLMK